MQNEEVRIVKGVDERLTGEAYVHISGSRAKLRLALAKDRTLMPVHCLTSLNPYAGTLPHIFEPLCHCTASAAAVFDACLQLCLRLQSPHMQTASFCSTTQSSHHVWQDVRKESVHDSMRLFSSCFATFKPSALICRLLAIVEALMSECPPSLVYLFKSQ